MTEPNGDIDAVTREIDQLIVGGNPNVDLRVLVVKPPQSRNQPLDRKRLKHIDPQWHPLDLSMQGLQRHLQVVQEFPNERCQDLSVMGQSQTARWPIEKLQTP